MYWGDGDEGDGGVCWEWRLWWVGWLRLGLLCRVVAEGSGSVYAFLECQDFKVGCGGS